MQDRKYIRFQFVAVAIGVLLLGIKFLAFYLTNSNTIFSDAMDVEMFIHTDPCIPTSCRICSKSDCKVRKKPFEERITWQLENVLENLKHK